MFVWLPSVLALAAVVFALFAGPTGPARPGALDVALHHGTATVSSAQSVPADAAIAHGGPASHDDDAAAAPPAAQHPPEDPGSAPAASDADTPRDSGAPALDVPLDVWPLSLPGGQLDALAAQGERLFVAVQDPPARPLIDPAVVRVVALDPQGQAVAAPWEAAILGPSPLALAASGRQVLAVWSHRAHPGRELAILRVGETPASAAVQVVHPPEDTAAFTPTGAPVVAAAADGGWVACSASETGAPRCAHVDAEGAAQWVTLGAMARYRLWRLFAQGDGYLLFGLACEAEACRTPQVVALRLDGAGRPHGRRRVIARMQWNRGLGVVPVGAAALLFGRRAGAKESTALLVRERGVSEQDGRWNRTAGGVADEDGALLVEVDRLHMEGGVPVTGFRPRRFALGDGRRKPEAWPAAVTSRQPHALEQRLLESGGVLAFVDPPGDGVVRGVALRPRPAGAAGLAHVGDAPAGAPGAADRARP